MKRFIGTKVLMAVAMTLGAYNEKRGWKIPENEDPEREGYFVEYDDGYQSWSPKEVFESSYVLANENGHKTFENAVPLHQARVMEEATELSSKISRLSEFVSGNSIFENLDVKEKKRLKLQLVTMNCYYAILAERIDAF